MEHRLFLVVLILNFLFIINYLIITKGLPQNVAPIKLDQVEIRKKRKNNIIINYFMGLRHQDSSPTFSAIKPFERSIVNPPIYVLGNIINFTSRHKTNNLPSFLLGRSIYISDSLKQITSNEPNVNLTDDKVFFSNSFFMRKLKCVFFSSAAQ